MISFHRIVSYIWIIVAESSEKLRARTSKPFFEQKHGHFIAETSLDKKLHEDVKMFAHASTAYEAGLRKGVEVNMWVQHQRRACARAWRWTCGYSIRDGLAQGLAFAYLLCIHICIWTLHSFGVLEVSSNSKREFWFRCCAVRSLAAFGCALGRVWGWMFTTQCLGLRAWRWFGSEAKLRLSQEGYQYESISRDGESSPKQ